MSDGASIARSFGWDSHFQRGTGILAELARSTPDVTAYRGEKVAFCGGGAIPGATNDLQLADDFYVRITLETERDLRPHAVWWEVIVCGEVLQVLPANRIIVLRIDPADWRVLQTG